MDVNDWANSMGHGAYAGLYYVTQSCLTLFDLRLFVTWTVARQASLSMKILQARILEWVAMPSSWSFLRQFHKQTK